MTISTIGFFFRKKRISKHLPTNTFHFLTCWISRTNNICIYTNGETNFKIYNEVSNEIKLNYLLRK